MLTFMSASQVLRQIYHQAAQGYVHGSPEGAYLDALSHCMKMLQINSLSLSASYVKPSLTIPPPMYLTSTLHYC